MSEKENEDRCDQFWNAIEKETNSHIPLYIRNVLRYHGFNSAMSIKLLEEQDLIDVEQSVRSGIMNDFCSSSVAEDTTKSETKSHPIYGPFALQVEKFSFLQGFKKTLLAISAHIRDNGSNNVGKALKEKQQQQPSNIFKRSARSAQVSSQSTVSESGESKQAGETSHRIDIVKERSILLNRIIDWIKSFFIPDVFEKCKDKLNHEMLVLKIVEPDEFVPVVKLSAEARCPKCNSRTLISMISKRLVGGGRGKPNWCLSNFQSHIKLHFKNAEHPNQRNEQQSMNLDAYMSTSDGDKNTRKNVTNIAKDTPGENDGESIVIQDNEENATATTVPKKRKYNLMVDEDDSSEDEIENKMQHVNPNFSSVPKQKKRKYIDKRSRKFKGELQLNRAACSPGQTRIPHYFKIADEIQILVAKNRQLAETLHRILTDLENASTTPALTSANTKTSSLLQLLTSSAEKNTSKGKNGYRHDETIKMFMAYIKMVGGKLLYETLHANLPTCIPSPSIINKYIEDKGPRIIEGLLRNDELLEYLEKRNLPKAVSISEDGTRMNGKICYDPHTNKLTGFSLPLDENGMPITANFMARNLNEIVGHFQNDNNTVSTIAYTIMAQPLSTNAGPFALTLYSTDNKFTAIDVIHRWIFIRQELRKKGIDVLNFASDGDARLVRAMKIETGIGTNPQHSTNENDNELSAFIPKWFNCKMFNIHDPLFIQDFIHILTKLRNRMLRASAILPLGNGVVCKSFLKYLIENVPKDQHCLTATDIDPKDRQNSESASKICSVNTRDCLLKYVPGSKSTVLYLKMMNAVTSSMLDQTMKTTDRVSNMWYGLFVLRIWRSWLQKFEKPKNKKRSNLQSESPIYSLQENFVSNNAYTCIEINAHSLILLIEKLRAMNRPDLMLTQLLGSQSCESSFRQLRSMTTTNSTVINFNMVEMIYRLKKVQLQSDIISSTPDNVKFPRIEKKTTTLSDSELPSKEELETLIENARVTAIADMLEVGIDVKDPSLNKIINFQCQIKPSFMPRTEPRTDFHSDLDDCDIDADDLHDPDDMDFVPDDESVEELEIENAGDDLLDAELRKDLNTFLSGPINTRNHDTLGIDLRENSPYCLVRDASGNEKVVRKSSICWLLSKDKHSLSTDRLRRVAQSEVITRNQHPNLPSVGVVAENVLLVNEFVNIGEWCLVKQNEKILVGLVLGFCYLNGTTHRTKEYSRSFAPIVSPDTNSHANTIGFLCTFYRYATDGTLSEETQNSKYISLSSYLATIVAPTFENNLLELNGILINRIKSFVVELNNRENLLVKKGKRSKVSGRTINIESEYEESEGSTQESIKLLDFAIVSVPTSSGSVKYYVGQICEIVDDDIKINFLRKSKSKFENEKQDEKFCFPEIVDLSYVKKKETVQILDEPVINRRNQLIFLQIKYLHLKMC